MTRKNKKITTYIFICSLVGIGLSTLIGITYFKHIKKEKIFYKANTECDHIHFANLPIEPTTKLNDPNDIHLIHAQKNGLKKTFATDDEFHKKIGDYVRKSILIEVTENRFYQLKELTHSQPYLIPEAVDLLNEIGYRFQKRLQEKKYNNYRFRITSLLRTEEAQNTLGHRNSNATGHSAHIYGTTVDISYKNFYNVKADSIESSYEAVQTLTQVLSEMREQCKLLAVRERHQSCFHITVVLCKPTKYEDVRVK